MRITLVFSIVTALSMPSSVAWSQEAESDSTPPAPTQAASQSDQDTDSATPRKQQGMMKGRHGMGRHGMRHCGKKAGKGQEMRHDHHQEVLKRLDHIEKRQILIETMLRELLLDEY